MRIVAVINQKGGVGKTTTTLNVAHALALAGQRVLALDLDPQGHLSAGLGVRLEEEDGLDAVLLDGATLDEVATPAREQLSLVAAGPRLGELEFMSEGGAKRGFILREALAHAKPHDFVLIDCPPSTGLLAMNALLAADEVLVPVSGDFLALHALSRFVGVCTHIESTLNKPLRRWVAVTRFHGRRRLARDVQAKLWEYFPAQVLATPVRESAALAESPSYGKTIFEYERTGNGALDYRALAEDLLQQRTH